MFIVHAPFMCDETTCKRWELLETKVRRQSLTCKTISSFSIRLSLAWLVGASCILLPDSRADAAEPNAPPFRIAQSQTQQAEQAIPEGRVRLQFTNTLDAPVDVYVQVSDGANPDLVDAIGAGQSAEFYSEPGLLWLFGVNRQPINSYRAGNDALQEFAISAPQSQQQSGVAVETAPTGQNQQTGTNTADPYNQPVPSTSGLTITGDNLVEPPGLQTSSLTLYKCAKMRLMPGPAFDICAYLRKLRRRDPAGYERYLKRVEASQPNGSNSTFSNTTQQGSVNRQAVSFPKAESWGGVVRARPSTDSKRIGSLQQGTPITIVANSGVEMNGFMWFEIEFGNGKNGYQWGGIICGQEQPIEGAYKVCE